MSGAPPLAVDNRSISDQQFRTRCFCRAPRGNQISFPELS